MKITLDLADLVERGKLTAEEASRLSALAARDSGTLGVNVLVGFGIVAVVAGAGALLPSALTAIVLGALLSVLGLGIMSLRADGWHLLAQICIVTGIFAFCGGLAVLDNGSLRSMLAVAVVLAGASVLAHSGLLIAAAVLVVGGCLGSSTDYQQAMYSLTVEEPTLTIVVFAIIALATYLISLRTRAQYERLAIIAARTAMFMINFGFWIGSLWGDRLLRPRSLLYNDPSILTDFTARSLIVPPQVFSIGWAAALIGACLWAMRANRRWVVNIVAVFGAIHFYTQWFETLGANPATVFTAGLLMLAFAFGMWRFNRYLEGAVVQ